MRDVPVPRGASSIGVSPAAAKMINQGTQQGAASPCRWLGWGMEVLGARPGPPQEGEQGVQPGKVALVTLSPRASSEARGLMQGWGQEPAGTGTEAAAPGILHAKGGLERSHELTSSWGQGEGKPGRQLREQGGEKRGHG